LPSAVRDPILQAVELLGRNQPTFWSPPRYHALEEPVRGTPTQSTKGRTQKRICSYFDAHNSSQSLPAPQHQDMQRWMDAASGMDSALLGTDPSLFSGALPLPGPAGVTGESFPSGFPPYAMASQFPMCQWVPMGLSSRKIS